MKRKRTSPFIEADRGAWLSVLLLLFMLALALIPALRTTHGLAWGSVIDLHRDESFVRSLLEGRYGQDPTYLGHALWYPPLMTWLEAAVVAITGLPVSTAIVQMGPYANLLAPIAFFIMAWHFLGPVRAGMATAVFLFFSVGQEPSYAVATYSARLLPVSFSQTLFYLELILVDRALRSSGALPAVLVGLGAGITFLAHPAPALIAVLLFGTVALVRLVRSLRTGDRSSTRRWLRTALLSGAAFLVASLPLTWYVVGHYGMHTLNRAGFLFTYYVLSVHELGLFIHYNLSVFSLVALVGIWLVARRSVTLGIAGPARNILLLWLAISLLLLLYTYLVSLLDLHYGIKLPGIVPSFHFYFYVKGALAVFAGIAAHALFQLVWMRLDGRSKAWSGRAALVCLSLTAVACTLIHPSYATRRDLWATYHRDLAFLEDRDAIEVAERMGDLLSPHDVVLCDIQLGGWPMLPTARHMVATEPTFGNPYVDQMERTQDNERLLRGMQVPLEDTERLMAKYGVTNLLVAREELADLPLADKWFPKEVFSNGEYVLLGR